MPLSLTAGPGRCLEAMEQPTDGSEKLLQAVSLCMSDHAISVTRRISTCHDLPVRIFISWSGAKAMAAAHVLRDWLPSVIQSLDKPFVSDVDIESGANWSASIGSELAAARFGIVCVTRQNQDRPWLNFEAGAISKLVGGAVPLLIDFESAGDLIGGPMSQLQIRVPDRDGITKLMYDINRRLDSPLDTNVLDLSLARSFAELEARLEEIRNDPTYADQGPPKRSLEDKVDELLRLARSDRTSKITNVIVESSDSPAMERLPAASPSPGRTKMLTVRLRPEDEDALRFLTEHLQASPASIVRDLIRTYAQREFSAGTDER